MSPVDPATTGEPTRRKRRRRSRLSDEAAAHVRELIISGQLSAGEFIRPETAAQELDMSATPAREGLLALQTEGFLTVEPRRGFLVSPLSAQDLRDIFDAQALLAGELTARDALVATPSDVHALENLQSELDVAAARGDYDRVERLNFAFHRTIYRLARAPKISWLLGATLRYAPREFFAAVSGWPEAAAHDHHAVLTALRNRDGEAARAAMSRHVTGARALLAEHLGRPYPRGKDR